MASRPVPGRRFQLCRRSQLCRRAPRSNAQHQRQLPRSATHRTATGQLLELSESTLGPSRPRSRLSERQGFRFIEADLRDP